MVIVRKSLSHEQGEQVLFDDIRYFFYITTRQDLTAAQVVEHARCECKAQTAGNGVVTFPRSGTQQAHLERLPGWRDRFFRQPSSLSRLNVCFIGDTTLAYFVKLNAPMNEAQLLGTYLLLTYIRGPRPAGSSPMLQIRLQQLGQP